MAKNAQQKSKNGKNKKAGKGGGGAGNSAAMRPRRAGVALDAAARSYGRLLADPCYQRTVQPLYNSGGTGQLVRVESDFILGAEATSVGAALIFTPGIINATTGSCGVIIPTTVVNSDTASITWSSAFTRCPGVGMAAMFGSVRAVAACIQMQYVGSEQTRAGVFSMAQMSRGACGLFTTVADIRSSSERVLRVPDGVVEMRWTPTGDSDTFNTVGGTGLGNESALPSLIVTASGIPSSTGIRVRLVQVLEWSPKPGSGADSNSVSTASDNTLGQVLRYMESTAPTWRFDLMSGMAAYAPKLLTFL